MPESGSYERVPRVLFVDDDDVSRFVYEHFGSPYGLMVHVAASGGEALSVAPVLGPDVIVLDVRLPDLNGFQVLARLRANPATRAIPVILMSCDDSVEVRAAAKASGCQAYVVKPFRPEEVVELVCALAARPRDAEDREPGRAARGRSA